MRAFVVDAFTDTAFRGNSAGVVLLDEPRDDTWLQAVAAEFRHAETAFVSVRTDGDHQLRWFTPTTEVDLCGHATVATAHALATSGRSGPFTFHTRSGILRADADADAGQVTLDFPTATVRQVAGVTGTDDATAALGATVLEAHWTSGDDLLCVLTDEQTVASLQPDLHRVAALGARGVIVTAAAAVGSGRDVVSRYFAPNLGIPEDPVTGSTHCALAPFWAPRLGHTAMTADQLSERGGRIHVTLRGERVLLRGHAVLVLNGELHV